MNWTSAGTNTQFTITGLNLLQNQSYFINVWAKDDIGNLCGVASSDGISVDTTAPLNGNVYDDGVYTTSTTTLSASWDAPPATRTASATDGESGISEFSYSIGTSAGATDVVNWTSANLNTSIQRTDLTLLSGTTYFINVRAKNGAGLLSTVVSSNGITADHIAPNAGTVTDEVKGRIRGNSPYPWCPVLTQEAAATEVITTQ